MTWDTSRSTSAWLAAQRAAVPAPYRAWVDEAFRQAGEVGRLQAELHHVVATVEAVLLVYEQDVYRDPRPSDATLRDLTRRLRELLSDA